MGIKKPEKCKVLYGFSIGEFFDFGDEDDVPEKTKEVEIDFETRDEWHERKEGD